jgi:DNA-binding response OmpR family regulator
MTPSLDTMRREEKILIVEDNPMIAQAIEDAGVQLRYSCDRVTDGWDAIEKLETEEYAAIVIDANVPRHSGYGVLTYLREEIGDELNNVIVLTSTDRNEVRRFGEQLRVVATQAEAVAEMSLLATARN